MLEKKRKADQEKEKQRLDAIEMKIENARKRLEQQKKVKSQNAKNTLKKKGTPVSYSQKQENLNDLEYERENEDFDDIYDNRSNEV